MHPHQGIVAEDKGLEVIWTAFCLRCEWKERYPWKGDAAGSLVNHKCKDADASPSGV
jgi:hypothetical protein